MRIEHGDAGGNARVESNTGDRRVLRACARHVRPLLVWRAVMCWTWAVSYTHLRAHETEADL
eukprot:3467789-Rhodomonas_salina.1